MKFRKVKVLNESTGGTAGRTRGDKRMDLLVVTYRRQLQRASFVLLKRTELIVGYQSPAGPDIQQLMTLVQPHNVSSLSARRQ